METFLLATSKKSLGMGKKKKIIPRLLIILLIQQKSMGGPGIKVRVDAVDKIYTNLRIHFTELHWDAFTGIANKID